MPKDTRGATDVNSDPATSATGKMAALYSMALPDHLCPSGQKARWLLDSQEFELSHQMFLALRDG